MTDVAYAPHFNFAGLGSLGLPINLSG